MRDIPETTSELEAEGVPDLEGPLASKVATGDGQEGIAPPGVRPVASVDFGTTANEQRAGEPLAGRLAREEPDPALDIDLESGEPMVEPPDPVGHGYAAEESAMHVVTEVPGAVDNDDPNDPDGYGVPPG